MWSSRACTQCDTQAARRGRPAALWPWPHIAYRAPVFALAPVYTIPPKALDALPVEQVDGPSCAGRWRHVGTASKPPGAAADAHGGRMGGAVLRGNPKVLQFVSRSSTSSFDSHVCLAFSSKARTRDPPARSGVCIPPPAAVRAITAARPRRNVPTTTQDHSSPRSARPAQQVMASASARTITLCDWLIRNLRSRQPMGNILPGMGHRHISEFEVCVRDRRWAIFVCS